jgi:hypothetical protein
MDPFRYAKSFYSNDDLPQQLTSEFALLLLSLVARTPLSLRSRPRLPQDFLHSYHLCGRVFAGGDCDA